MLIGTEELWTTYLRFWRMLHGQMWTRRMLSFTDLLLMPLSCLEVELGVLLLHPADCDVGSDVDALVLHRL